MRSPILWALGLSLCAVACAQVEFGGDSYLAVVGGTIVNADGEERKADILIKNDKIDRIVEAMEPSMVPPDAKIVDARGKYVMPGGIDPHTHLEMPFMGQVACDNFLSGHRAALAGGTTFHIDFALPVDGNPLAGMAEWRRKGDLGAMDYGLHMAITSWEGELTAAAMAVLVDAGINSFKFFLAYKGALMVSDDAFLAGLQHCKTLGALAQVHAENGEAVAAGQQRMIDLGITGPEGHAMSRPAILEGEATGRAARLAAFVNTPLYVVHVMSADAALEIEKAKASGARIIGEAVASGLECEESKMWDPDFKTAAQFVMSPPIRSAQHREVVREKLAEGVLTIVGTDHAVFNSTQKAAGKDDFRILPNGVNGIEERLHITWDVMVNSGRMTRQEFVAAVSTNAAKAFNIYPQKGVIAEGSDADVIVFDPNETHTISAKTHHSRMDTNIYEGRTVRGKVVTTISRGRLVWHMGQLNVSAKSARFVPLKPFGPLFDGLEDDLEKQFPYGKVPVDRTHTKAHDEL